MSFDEVMMKLLDWHPYKAEQEVLRLSLDNALLDVIESMSPKSTARMRRWIQNADGYYEWEKASRWGRWSAKRKGQEVVVSRMKTGSVPPEWPSTQAIAAAIDVACVKVMAGSMSIENGEWQRHYRISRECDD